MSVCVSHGGQTSFQSDSAPNEVLVATASGVVFVSRPSATGAWSERRRALEGKHISTLMIAPGGTIFAGTHGAGIYASSDGGETWERRDSGLSSENVYSMSWVQAGNELRLYAGTEPARIFRSTNLGASWKELPALAESPSKDSWTFPAPPHTAHVKHISFDPRSADVVYASIEVGGALKSFDGGDTWQELKGFYEDVHRVVAPLTAPDRLYITGGEGVYHSADAGANWVHLTDRTARIAYPDALVPHPENADLIFMAGSICSPNGWRTTHDADSRVARSRDAGKTWTYLEGGLPAHIRGNTEAMSMASWKGGYSLFVGTTDGEVFFSEDEGEHWSTIANGLPPVSKGGHFRNLRDDAQLVGAAAR